jgi:hypothetical protein
VPHRLSDEVSCHQDNAHHGVHIPLVAWGEGTEKEGGRERRVRDGRREMKGGEEKGSELQICLSSASTGQITSNSIEKQKIKS